MSGLLCDFYWEIRKIKIDYVKIIVSLTDYLIYKTF